MEKIMTYSTSYRPDCALSLHPAPVRPSASERIQASLSELNDISAANAHLQSAIAGGLETLLSTVRPESHNPGSPEGIRSALGLHADEPLYLDVLMDRSGSVTADPQSNAAQQEIIAGLAGVETESTFVTITGYDGMFSSVNFYPIKPVQCAVNQNAALAGGGGTPTTEVLLSRIPHLTDKIGTKVLAILTDGRPYDEDALRAISKAQQQGIQVVTVVRPTEFAEMNESELNQHFGETWVLIDEWTQAYDALVKNLPA
jgi:hypothetical protein